MDGSVLESPSRQASRENRRRTGELTVPGLFRDHGALVWRALRYLGVPEQDLPDASQEVFAVAHRKLPGFRGEARPETWLYGIALRVATAFRRRAHGREELVAELPELSTGPTQEHDASRRSARVLIQRALDTIEPAQREVFILSEIEQLPMAEVARAVGCPLFTAYSRRRIARRRMRRAIQEMTEEEPR